MVITSLLLLLIKPPIHTCSEEDSHFGIPNKDLSKPAN